MKLKSIIFLFCIFIFYQNAFGMNFKKHGKDLIEGVRDGISDTGGTLEETLQAVVREMGKTAADESKRVVRETVVGVTQGVGAAMGAPIGASMPQSIIHGVNMTLGTQGHNLAEVATEFGQAAVQPIFDSVTAQLGAPKGSSIPESISMLGQQISADVVQPLINQCQGAIDACINDVVGCLGAQQGTTLPDALNDFQDQAILSAKAKLANLKNESINYTKSTLHSVGKKVLIAGAVVGTAALSYYLFKKLTHPGSLNRDSLNKSNLLVESSGFTNGVMSRVANLFRSNKPLKKLILAPHGARQAKEALKNFVTVIKNLRSSSRCLNFKSLLLNGPKGTGKTLFVDHLIKISNLDYVKINSSTFMNFEDGTGSKAIAALFGLLKRPKKEIIVVIEEADILLNRPAYKSKLMDLLRWLKSNNGKFMLVVCAENKKHLDNELLALIDNNIEFALPAEQERKKFLAHHNAILVKEHEKTALAEILSSILNNSKINEIARQTDGFSYAKLELLIDQIKTDLLRNNDAFTKEHVNAAVHDSLVVKAALLNA